MCEYCCETSRKAIASHDDNNNLEYCDVVILGEDKININAGQYNCGMSYSFTINYCPVCGRKMGVKNGRI